MTLKQSIVALSHLFFSCTLTKTASLKLQYQRNSSILPLVDKSNGTVEKQLVYFTLYLQNGKSYPHGACTIEKVRF